MKAKFTQMALVLSFVLVPAGAFAQMMGGGMMGGDAGKHGMMGMHDMEMGMDGGKMEMMKMMKVVFTLDLSPDQKKKIQMLKLSHQKEAIPLFSRIRMSSVEIEELLLQDPADMTKVKDKIKEKYDAMAKLEVSHLTLKQQVQSILTPEQRQRMESMMMGAPAEPAPKSPDPHGH